MTSNSCMTFLMSKSMHTLTHVRIRTSQDYDSFDYMLTKLQAAAHSLENSLQSSALNWHSKKLNV